MAVQNDNSAEYPWRHPTKSSEDDTSVQDQQPTEGRTTCDAPPENTERLLDVGTVSSQQELNRSVEVAHRNSLQPGRRSGEDSNSSNTMESKSPAPEKDSWKNDTLVRFRVNHYFDYIAGTSTGGLVWDVQFFY